MARKKWTKKRSQQFTRKWGWLAGLIGVGIGTIIWYAVGATRA